MEQEEAVKMADFTRFISYLYDYKAGARNRNLGFAKVEARGGMCRVGINLNHGQVLTQEMTLYGYICEQDGVYLEPLGEMEKGSRERRWNFPLERLYGRGVRLENLFGLILLSKDRKNFLLSVWVDSPRSAEEICHGKVRELRPTEPAEERMEPWSELEQKIEGHEKRNMELTVEYCGTVEQTKQSQDELQVPPDDDHTRYQIDAENDRIAEECRQPQERPAKPEPLERALTRLPMSEAIPDAWRRLCKLFPTARPFEPSAWEVLCISLQDIGRLPPENWVWGSNHFLLHGFYQYHHLILARQRIENKIYLGIPGEFGVNEKFMAGMFGLERFQRERQGKGDKGYWLAPIRIN